ncbi:hypothetical protein ACA910_002580 [Epithemia clementina (nom. ined.)]
MSNNPYNPPSENPGWQRGGGGGGRSNRGWQHHQPPGGDDHHHRGRTPQREPWGRSRGGNSSDDPSFYGAGDRRGGGYRNRGGGNHHNDRVPRNDDRFDRRFQNSHAGGGRAQEYFRSEHNPGRQYWRGDQFSRTPPERPDHREVGFEYHGVHSNRSEEQPFPNQNYPPPMQIDPPRQQEQQVEHDGNADPEVLPVVENWEGLERGDKMWHLVPVTDREFYKDMILNELPKDFDERCQIATAKTNVALDRIWREETKERAAKNKRDSDEEDSDDEENIDMLDGMGVADMSDGNKEGSLSPPERYRKFINALRECVAMDYGFHVVPIRASQSNSCFCPCRKKMTTWRKLFDLEGEVDECVSSKGGDKPYTDQGFVAHCEEKAKGCLFHKLILEYIRALYTNYFNESTSHKALYKLNDSDWQRAEAIQYQRYYIKLKELQLELDEARREKVELERSIEELKKVNPAKAEVVKTKHTALEMFENELGLPPKVPSRVPTGAEIARLRLRFDLCFDRARKCFKKTKTEIAVVFQLEQRFDLQKLFDSWSGKSVCLDRDNNDDKKRQKAIHYLFLENKHLNTKYFTKTEVPDDDTDPVWLFKWDVQFDDVKPGAKQDDSGQKKKKKDKEAGTKTGNEAKDKGGPQRAFLSEVWRQLDSIRFEPPDLESKRQRERLESNETEEKEETRKDKEGKGTRYLFAVQDNGELWPQTNDFLLFLATKENAKDKDPKQVGTDNEKHEEMTEEKKLARVEKIVSPVGRAIGRIILHTIAYRIVDKEQEEDERLTIADHVLPRPMQRYLLQGIKPTDERYPLRDLVIDFLNFSVKEETDSLSEKVEANESENEQNRRLKKIREYLEGYFEVHEITEGTLAEKLRKAMEKEWIDSRSIVLDSLKVGLGNGASDHRSLEVAGLDLISLAEMDSLFFSKLPTRADDVIQALHPEYDVKEKAVGTIEYQTKMLSINEGRVEGLLVDLLRKKEAEGNKTFSADFVEFATGARFIPQGGAKILIEFNSGEEGYKGVENSLPVAHTCVRTIKFPATAYEGDLVKLEKKFDCAIKDCLKNFSMA